MMVKELTHMKLREVSVGQTFRFVGVDDIDIYVKIRQGKPPTECELINLSKERRAGYVTGDQEVEKVCVLHVVLEKPDLDNLDNLLSLEGENESRLSRVTRMLEGESGAIAKESEVWS